MLHLFFLCTIINNDIAIDFNHSTKISIRSHTTFFSNSNWYCIHTRMTRKQMLRRREKYSRIRRAYTYLSSLSAKKGKCILEM